VRRDSCPAGVSSPANVVIFVAHALFILTVRELAAEATLLHRVYPSPGVSFSSGGGEESLLDRDGLLFLVDRADRLSDSSSSKLVRDEAYPAPCFMRSRKEAAEEVVESLLRFVPDLESERVSYDGSGLRRERDDGMGGGWEPDLPWFMEVIDFCGRTWRAEGRGGASPSLSYRSRSASLVLATERERGPGPLGRPAARERLDMEARNN